MFDTMTITKTVGGVCGALLVFLLGNWAATSIYAMGAGEHGAEGEVTQAYTIVTAAAPAAAPATEAAAGAATVDVAALVAAGDVAAGEKVFGKCKACHKVDGGNATGPHLNGVVGRPIASIADFKYSQAMTAHAGDSWTPEHLFTFLQDPKAFAPGTKMTFAGLPKDEERVNLIAYLSTTKP